MLCFEVPPPTLPPPFVDEGSKTTEALAKSVEEGRVEVDDGDEEERLEGDREVKFEPVASGSGPTY